MVTESSAIVGQRRGDNRSKCSPFQPAADVLFNVDVTQPLNPFQLSLEMTSSINSTTKAVLMSAADMDELPSYAFDLATLPEHQNGLGIYNPANSA
eukprot:14341710-Ditylum_brightwellii.AAC.1